MLTIPAVMLIFLVSALLKFDRKLYVAIPPKLTVLSILMPEVSISFGNVPTKLIWPVYVLVKFSDGKNNDSLIEQVAVPDNVMF